MDSEINEVSIYQLSLFGLSLSFDGKLLYVFEAVLPAMPWELHVCCVVDVEITSVGEGHSFIPL